MSRQIQPHISDRDTQRKSNVWMGRSEDKVSYEINFNRHSYKYRPPRPLEEIDANLKKAEEEIFRLLREVTE